jgi:hypothetical protein
VQEANAIGWTVAESSPHQADSRKEDAARAAQGPGRMLKPEKGAECGPALSLGALPPFVCGQLRMLSVLSKIAHRSE